MNITITVTTTTTIAALMQQSWFEVAGPYIVACISGALVIVASAVSQHLARKTQIESAADQREERRREKLSESIYEPLLKQIRLVQDQFDEGKKPDPGGLRAIIDMVTFFQAADGIRKAAQKTWQSVKLCGDFYLHAEEDITKIINEGVDNLAKAGKLSSKLGQTREVTYRAKIGVVLVDEVTLIECAIMGRDPYELLHARTTLFSDRRIDCIVSGEPNPIDGQSAKELAEAVLVRAREDTNLKLYKSYTSETIKRNMEPLGRMLQLCI